MKDKPENPQAFPVDTSHAHKAGMTLRDYFAAKAMQACLHRGMDVGGVLNTTISKKAYRIADAMLAERSKSDE